MRKWVPTGVDREPFPGLISGRIHQTQKQPQIDTLGPGCRFGDKLLKHLNNSQLILESDTGLCA